MSQYFMVELPVLTVAIIGAVTSMYRKLSNLERNQIELKVKVEALQRTISRKR